VTCNLIIGIKARVYRGRIIATMEMLLLLVGIAMEMLSIATETCRLVLLWVRPNRERSVFILLRWLVIDDRNMWEVYYASAHKVLS
jgi:hypothetical protein